MLACTSHLHPLIVLFEIALQLLVAAGFEMQLVLGSSACFLCTSHLHPLLVLCEIALQLCVAARFEMQLLLGSSAWLLPLSDAANFKDLTSCVGLFLLSANLPYQQCCKRWRGMGCPLYTAEST